MSYLGSVPVLQSTTFTGVNSQAFSPNGSTAAFTMNRTVAFTKDIEVIVDNVQQSPYDGSYSVNGTTLTFSENPPAGTNSIYVIYRDAPIGSITDPLAVKKAGDTMTGQLNASGGSGNTASLIASNSYDFDQFQIRQPNRGGNFGWQCSGVNSENYVVIDNQRTSVLSIHGKTNHILRTNDLDRFVIDASGRVTKPFQPAFYARRTAGHLSAFTGTILFDSVRFNIGNHYDTGTGRFTAPVSGIYIFSWSALPYSTGWCEVELRKNGVEIAGRIQNRDSNSAGDGLAAKTAPVQMNAGDYIEAYAMNTYAYANDGLWTTFSGYLLG